MSDYTDELKRDMDAEGIVLPVIVNGWRIDASGYFDARHPEGGVYLRQIGKMYAFNSTGKTFVDEHGVTRDAEIFAGTFDAGRDSLRNSYNVIKNHCESKRGGVTEL